MSAIDGSVEQWTRARLEEDPELGAVELHRRAQEARPGLEALSTRQFRARYVTPARRYLGLEPRREERDPPNLPEHPDSAVERERRRREEERSQRDAFPAASTGTEEQPGLFD